MDALELLTLSVSLFGFYTYFKLKNSLNKASNTFMSKEVNRMVHENAIAYDSYTSEGRFFKRGIALIKNDNGKYDLIPQVKVCEAGLN